MPKHVSRRRFLQASAAGLSFGFWSGRSSGSDKKSSANSRLHVGVIGLTNQGAYDMNEVARCEATIVALCDVDENRAVNARKQFPKAPFFTDYRRLIDSKGIDAVTVGIPDHHHALATLHALRSGLHVYCEKPLTHTVAEARLVAETAAKHKRVTQMGTQIHAGSNYRRVVELIQSGAIGRVKEVHVWVATAYGGKDRPTETPKIPEGLHWDLWLGPAPERPYHGTYVPFYWRGWWD